MAENKISYLNRNYDDYRNSIIEIARLYYPDVFENLNDASVGAWLIDVLSDIGDNLNYHIDKSVQETSLMSANEFSSIQDIARSNGLRIPYKKAAMVEIELSCRLPLYNNSDDSDGSLSEADERYAPYVKRGTKFSNGITTFELVSDIDFKEQFDSDGISNRQIIANRDSNGNIVSYTYKKLGVASACQTKVMKQILTANEIKPFMEILINDSNVIGVESIIVKQGTNLNTDPLYSEFYVDEEEYLDNNGLPVKRFFEVDNLIEQYRFGHEIESTEYGQPIGDVKINNVRHRNYYNPVWEISEKAEITDAAGNVQEVIPIRMVTKGKWKPLKHKFITEYTNDWNLKIIFGPGIENQYGKIPEESKKFTQYQMSRMEANDYLGVLPEKDCTLYVLYKIGGGEISNIAEGTLTNIIELNMDIDGCANESGNSEKIRRVKSSMEVTNTTPSYGGKDAPTRDEIRYMIKYNAASQNRCVTLKDYISKIDKLPAKYGCPFRYCAIEENNKIIIYTLGLDYEGHLMSFLSETVAENIKEYLSNYKMLNDLVEIQSGKIINLAFRLKVYIDKTYDKSEVVKRIIDMVYDYMDIRRHIMGEDIYVGDLQKEISKLDGVDNLASIRVFNKVGVGYSEDASTQQMVDYSSCDIDEYDEYESETVSDNEIDLKRSDYMLFSEANSMFEIKYKNNDIKIEVRTRN